MKQTRKMVAAAFLCAPLLLNPALAFSDMNNASWADDAADFVSGKGLLKGISDDSFCPGLPMTRAAFINSLYKLAGTPSVDNTDPYIPGVAVDAVYLSAARWAISEKIVAGGIYPDEKLPRQQLATLLFRFSNYNNISLPSNDTLSASSFKDYQNIQPYALDAMNWCVKTGLLSGLSDNCLHPEKYTTRAEAAVILKRYVSFANLSLEDEDKEYLSLIESGTAFKTLSGTVSKKHFREYTLEGGLIESLVYTDTTGAVAETKRVASKATLPANTAKSVRLNGSSGTIRWFDSNAKTWRVENLTDTVKPKGMYFISMDSGEEAILVTPMCYIDHDNSMIEALPDKNGTLRVINTGSGFTFSLNIPALGKGEHAEMLTVASKEKLIIWNSNDSEPRWSTYNLTGENRWCFDGYYYIAPSSYYPYGPNYYHFLPAPYIAAGLMRLPYEPAARVLGLMMIDIMQQQQNSYGYIPSKAGSEWLRDDYNISPGYYDTRFNTEFWVACINAAENFGAVKWLPAAENYAEFFMDFAEKHHHTVRSGNEEGWLVEDYWSPDGKGKSTHTSLNHQAAEASYLYRLADFTGKEKYAEFADKMVKAIELTEKKWVMPDSNLYYSYMPDGTMRDGDYPYLTYNDLIALNKLYAERHGEQNAALKRLAEAKHVWMDANHILAFANDKNIVTDISEYAGLKRINNTTPSK